MTEAPKPEDVLAGLLNSADEATRLRAATELLRAGHGRHKPPAANAEKPPEGVYRRKLKDGTSVRIYPMPTE